jgi:crotonobetainyl-CoA hydratase
MSYKSISFEISNNVAIVTLNRPEVHNAVNSQVCQEVGDALEVIANEKEIRVAIITGAGSKAFCAGADLKAVAAGEFGSKEQAGKWGFAGICDHYINKPIIAAVNGYALGGGTEIALAADIVVASESATFGLPEVTRGLIAGAGGILRLSRQIPTKIAARMILQGSPISAKEAERWGLVNEVVPPSDLMSVALNIANSIAANAPISVRFSKEVLYRGLDASLDFPPDAREINQQYVDMVVETEDALEGARAFSERRKANWTDQ